MKGYIKSELAIWMAKKQGMLSYNKDFQTILWFKRKMVYISFEERLD
jgi:hypothetical protein